MDEKVTIDQIVAETVHEINLLIDQAKREEDNPLRDCDEDMMALITDMFKGVLARHSDQMIRNDEDLPVTPLPLGKPLS